MVFQSVKICQEKIIVHYTAYVIKCRTMRMEPLPLDEAESFYRDQRVGILELSEIATRISSELWYVVATPWGDGDWIAAGSPEGGIYVCDCSLNTTEGKENGKVDSEKKTIAQNIAAHIVKVHNAYIKSMNDKCAVSQSAI